MSKDSDIRSRLNGYEPFRVLMADPDESLSSMYQEPLAQEGIEVVTAFSGIECVAGLREHVPDLLVLEPQLPWGGGDGVLAMMGDVPRLATIPVMILTSCQDTSLLNRVSRFPVNGYHRKPLAPHRLAKNIRTMLDHPRQRFSLAEQTGRLESSITKRTGGRGRNLCVETVDGRVIVRGRSESHYIKQLALAAVREAFEASESQSDRIELDIEVG